MSPGKVNPIFDKNGLYIIEGFEGRKFELLQRTWENHILRDKSRWYFKEQFDKIIETLKRPDCILQSPHDEKYEKYVVCYVKKFNDLYIWNTVTAIAYVYVVVNLNNNNIRTVYDSPNLKKWKQIWQRN